MVEKISPRARLEVGTAKSIGQPLTLRATGAPQALGDKVRNGPPSSPIRDKGATYCEMISF